MKEILKEYGVSMAYISKRFEIPYRTVQHWCGKGDDFRECPPYVKKMIAELLGKR